VSYADVVLGASLAAEAESAEAATAILPRLGLRPAVSSPPGAARAGADRFARPRLGVSPRLAPASELAAALERRLAA